MTLLHRPSIPLNKSLTILKVTYYYCYHYTRPSTTTRVLVRCFTISYSRKHKYAWRTFCAQHSTVWAKLLRIFTCYLSATLCTPIQHDSKLKNRLIFQLWGNIWGYNSRLTILDVANLHDDIEFTLQSIWNNEMLEYGNAAMVIKVLFLSSGAQSGVKFPGQFLKNGWTKTNALIYMG